VASKRPPYPYPNSEAGRQQRLHDASFTFGLALGLLCCILSFFFSPLLLVVGLLILAGSKSMLGRGPLEDGGYRAQIFRDTPDLLQDDRVNDLVDQTDAMQKATRNLAAYIDEDVPARAVARSAIREGAQAEGAQTPSSLAVHNRTTPLPGDSSYTFADAASLSRRPGMRTVVFPFCGVGHLARLSSRAVIENGAADPDWQEWKEARGVVDVTDSTLLRLTVSADAARDLTFLERLNPEDLAALALWHDCEPDWRLVARLNGLRGVWLPSTTTDAGLLALSPLWRLEHLCCLGTTRLAGHGLDCVRTMPHLRVLDLAEATALTDATFLPLGDHPTLSWLRLSNTTVQGTTLQCLRGCESLQALWLDATSVSSAEVTRLPALPALKDVNLWATKVDDACLVHLATFESLTALNLGRTAVTDDGIDHLSSLMNLENLVLEATFVTDRSVSLIGEFHRLRFLNLIGCRMSPTSADELRRRLPVTKIVFNEREL
jgi:hypothetical protein